MPTDFVGRPINVGDLVAYPMRRGSRMWMATIKVDAIQPLENSYVLLGFDANGRWTRTKNIQNCIVI